MNFGQSTDNTVMELVRLPIHSSYLAMAVFVALVGCSENKRNPPDDGDGDFSKKSVATCDAYLSCAAEQGPALLEPWGLSLELQQAMLTNCPDIDTAALPENAVLAHAALIAHCAP